MLKLSGRRDRHDCRGTVCLKSRIQQQDTHSIMKRRIWIVWLMCRKSKPNRQMNSGTMRSRIKREAVDTIGNVIDMAM